MCSVQIDIAKDVAVYGRHKVAFVLGYSLTHGHDPFTKISGDPALDLDVVI